MRRLLFLLGLLALAAPAHAQRWVTTWAASAQGPYPAGSPVLQPELKFALPNPEAKDQTFRLIIKPTLWGNRMRLRFSNAFGTKPVTFDTVFVGVQWSGAAITPGTNRPISFGGGKKTITVPPGGQTWSDFFSLPWISNPAAPELLGRKLAVSFHVAGSSGPMTWHAKAMQTSYITSPDAGALGELEDESAFPNSTTSWFFLDALDVQAPPEASVVVCLGDSITDGTASTLNGDDRWPDFLARRLRGAGIPMAVANEGIGSNQIAGPAEYSLAKPTAGGPSAVSRIDRDVIGLSGVTHVIWFEGINDFGTDSGATLDQVRDAMRAGVKHLREKIRGVKVIGATLTSAVGTSSDTKKPLEVEQKRRAFNEWMRNNGGVFDGVVDFDKATVDPRTGELRPEFAPASTGGPGDKLHPNRAGYMAMADAVDLRLLRRAEPARPRPRPAPQPSDENG